MALIVLIFLLVMTVGTVWLLYCSERTHTQRRRIIKAISVEPQWERLFKEWDRTSYSSHLWAVALFRDPYKLYSPDIQFLHRFP